MSGLNFGFNKYWIQKIFAKKKVGSKEILSLSQRKLGQKFFRGPQEYWFDARHGEEALMKMSIVAWRRREMS